MDVGARSGHSSLRSSESLVGLRSGHPLGFGAARTAGTNGQAYSQSRCRASAMQVETLLSVVSPPPLPEIVGSTCAAVANIVVRPSANQGGTLVCMPNMLFFTRSSPFLDGFSAVLALISGLVCSSFPFRFRDPSHRGDPYDYYGAPQNIYEWLINARYAGVQQRLHPRSIQFQSLPFSRAAVTEVWFLLNSFL
jgi:hypothetical protein